MFKCYIYRHLCFDNVYMPIKNLKEKKKEMKKKKSSGSNSRLSYHTKEYTTLERHSYTLQVLFSVIPLCCRWHNASKIQWITKIVFRIFFADEQLP